MEVDRAGLERLERDLPLAIIFEAQAVEIIDADIDRQVLRPIVLHAVEFDETALLESLRPCRGRSRAAASSVEASKSRVFHQAAEKIGMPGDDEMGVAAARP